MAAGKIVVSTDPQYPPQSELKPDGTFQGFDIDVATEIATRMGLKVEFTTPSWDTITAGSWGGRWDMSVGSMTITSKRQKILDFSPPYYYTPAQMAASKASGVTTLDGLSGKTVCVGEATTYLDWLNGALDFGTESPQSKPPAGITPITQSTDRLCAEAWKAGRKDWQGWLSSGPTVDQAIKDGLPLVAVGAPGLLRAPRRGRGQERPGSGRASSPSSPTSSMPCTPTGRSRSSPRSGTAWT